MQRKRGGALAAEVYATHARIALETRDWAEFNQCQTVLRGMHSRRARRSTCASGAEDASEDVVAEFAAYRLLYAASQSTTAELTRELRHLAREGALEPGRTHEYVASALRVVKAAATRACVAFFKAREDAPEPSRCPGFRALADLSTPAVRRDALRAMLRAYAGSRDGVPVAFAANVLGFGGGDDGAAAFEAFAASAAVASPFAFGVASDGTTRVLDARASLGLEPLPATRGPRPRSCRRRRSERARDEGEEGEEAEEEGAADAATTTRRHVFFFFFFSVSPKYPREPPLHPSHDSDCPIPQKKHCQVGSNPAILGAISREFVPEPREREISRVAGTSVVTPRARLSSPHRELASTRPALILTPSSPQTSHARARVRHRHRSRLS